MLLLAKIILVEALKNNVVTHVAKIASTIDQSPLKDNKKQ